MSCKEVPWDALPNHSHHNICMQETFWRLQSVQIWFSSSRLIFLLSQGIASAAVTIWWWGEYVYEYPQPLFYPLKGLHASAWILICYRMLDRFSASLTKWEIPACCCIYFQWVDSMNCDVKSKTKSASCDRLRQQARGNSALFLHQHIECGARIWLAHEKKKKKVRKSSENLGRSIPCPSHQCWSCVCEGSPLSPEEGAW